MLWLFVLLQLIFLNHGIEWKDPFRFTSPAVVMVSDPPATLDQLLMMMQTLMTDLNTGVLKANLMEITKKIARVSGILMDQLADKGDEQRLKEIENVIRRALQWRSTQSKEMNSVQLKRAMSIWEESTQYLLTNKDKLKSIAVSEVIFTIKTSAVAAYDTLQNIDLDIIRHPKVNDESVDRSCPELQVAFVLDGHTLSRLDSFMEILDHVMPIYKIKLMLEFGYYDDLNSSRFKNVLNEITSNFRNSLVKLEMEHSHKTGQIDAAFLDLVRKCQRLTYIKASAYFSDPETERIAMELVQARRRQQEMSKSQETPNKRAKLSSAEDPGSDPA